MDKKLLNEYRKLISDNNLVIYKISADEEIDLTTSQFLCGSRDYNKYFTWKVMVEVIPGLVHRFIISTRPSYYEFSVYCDKDDFDSSIKNYYYESSFYSYLFESIDNMIESDFSILGEVGHVLDISWRKTLCYFIYKPLANDSSKYNRYIVADRKGTSLSHPVFNDIIKSLAEDLLLNWNLEASDYIYPEWGDLNYIDKSGSAQLCDMIGTNIKITSRKRSWKVI